MCYSDLFGMIMVSQWFRKIKENLSFSFCSLLYEQESHRKEFFKP